MAPAGVLMEYSPIFVSFSDAFSTLEYKMIYFLYKYLLNKAKRSFYSSIKPPVIYKVYKTFSCKHVYFWLRPTKFQCRKTYIYKQIIIWPYKQHQVIEKEQFIALYWFDINVNSFASFLYNFTTIYDIMQAVISRPRYYNGWYWVHVKVNCSYIPQ